MNNISRDAISRLSLIEAFVMMCVLGLLAGLGHMTVAPIAAAPLASDRVPVLVEDYDFDPAVLTVGVGTTVVWGNLGEVDHTVTITGGANSGNLAPGQTFSNTFGVPGTYYYQCTIHPALMQGVVDVVDPSQVPVDLSVTIERNVPIAAGAVVTYQLSYANNDQENDAQNAVLSVTLPAASTLISSSVAPNSQAGRQLVYQLNTLAANVADTIELNVRLPNTLTVGSVVSLTARIRAANPDSGNDNNYAEDSEAIPGANVTLAKRLSEDSGPFIAGGIVTYSLDYTNRSSDVVANSVIVTDRLPTGLTFISALKEDDTGTSPISPTINGNLLTFNLGDVAPDGTGQLLVQVSLSSNLPAGQMVTNTAGIATTSPESAYDDNFAIDSQRVKIDGPDLWVAVTALEEEAELGDYQTYQIEFGNQGSRDASDVRLSLTLPAALTQIDFGAVPPTTFANGIATWNISGLNAHTTGDAFLVSAIISGVGRLTATATISSTSVGFQDGDPSDNSAMASTVGVAIHRPTIVGPDGAIVGPQPVFFGLGSAQATVSLYLSGTADLPGRLIGTDVVDADGHWLISATAPISPAGWYWFTATQQLANRVSPVSGVANFITPGLGIDSNSIWRNGERIGGINQEDIAWGPAYSYTLTLRIVRCGTPLTPTLQMLFFNQDGLQTGYQDFPGRLLAPGTGQVEFELMTPASDTEFELFVSYYCPNSSSAQQSVAVASSADNARLTTALSPNFFHGPAKKWLDCVTSAGAKCGGEDDKKKPPKPPGCQGCSDLPRGKRPQGTDPDGYVYDEAMVKAGATITQSVITRAWVTATQLITGGQFIPWNARAFGQTNPQYTDGKYPDRVLIPGYYSFFVPPGFYRIQVTASGFLPFTSQTVQVTTTLVTVHVPMKRATGPITSVQVVTSTRNIYLPVVRR